MTALARWFRWLLWPFRRATYRHAEPDAVVVMDLDFARKAISDGYTLAVEPGTVQMFVLGEDGEPLAEVWVTLDP